MTPIMRLFMTMSGWSMDTFLENVQQNTGSYGIIIVTVVGLVMVIIGVVKLAVNLINSGRGQANWVMTILLIVLGCILAFAGGWNVLEKLGKGASDTIYELGMDTILQGLFMR